MILPPGLPYLLNHLLVAAILASLKYLLVRVVVAPSLVVRAGHTLSALLRELLVRLGSCTATRPAYYIHSHIIMGSAHSI